MTTTTCLNCNDTVGRTYWDQRWSSAEHGDVCFAKSDLHRLHDVDVTIPAVRATFVAR